MNHEHYKDPTADGAIRKIRHEEERVNKTILAIKTAAWLGNFKITGRVRLEDKKTGRIYE